MAESGGGGAGPARGVVTVAEYFAGRPEARAIFDRLHACVDALDGLTTKVSKSQVAFLRGATFAAAWMPGRHLRARDAAPLVLTLFYHHREASPRWKAVVEPRPGRFTHHLELRSPVEVDGEVVRLLRAAWGEAG